MRPRVLRSAVVDTAPSLHNGPPNCAGADPAKARRRHLADQSSTKIYAGYGSGEPCDACGNTIFRAQAEYELSYPEDRRIFRMHFGCASLWETLRRKRELEPAL